jgi:outer membrane protein
MFRSIIITVFAVLLSTTVFGQKFGYINSDALITQMPEVKQADAKLETLQKQLQKQGQQKLQNLQAKAQELQRKEKQGEIAPKKLQEEAEVLKEEEMQLAQFEQDMQQQIMQKRQELYQPILDKVNTAIQEVAKEENYTYIFDASTGVILYADETTDVTDMVKQKLGL